MGAAIVADKEEVERIEGVLPLLGREVGFEPGCSERYDFGSGGGRATEDGEKEVVEDSGVVGGGGVKDVGASGEEGWVLEEDFVEEPETGGEDWRVLVLQLDGNKGFGVGKQGGAIVDGFSKLMECVFTDVQVL